MNEDDCKIPCEGLYADITYIQGTDFLGESNNFQTMKREYELYKRGNMADADYPSELAGISVYINSSINFPIDLRQVSKLHRVDIYFATPTFDEITKDLKASFMMKISTIGMLYHTF